MLRRVSLNGRCPKTHLGRMRLGRPPSAPGFRGVPSRAAVDRYLPDRWAAGASARAVIGRVKRQLVAFATRRAQTDLTTTLAASSPSDRKRAEAAAAAIEKLRAKSLPQPLIGDAIERWLPARLVGDALAPW